MTLETIYDGDGSDVTFNTNFDYLEQEDISVAVQPSGGSYATKTLDTHYTVSGQVVTFTSGNVPPNNSKVRIRRHTPVTQPRHTFYAGSTVTAKSLNDNTNQILNALEERGLAVDDETDQPFTIGTHNEIKVNSATNLEVVAGKITLDKMAINSVDSDQYVDGSIDLAHMSANSIDSDQYVDGSIDLIHMSANSIDSGQYVDGSIDGVHISNDAIDSQHYAAGSIDLEHMSSESVDEDNLHISNAGTNGQFLSKQSGNTGGLTWADVPSTSGFAVLSDEKTSNTSGGSYDTQNVWQTRVLNKEVDPNGIVTLSNNQFTLGAGHYLIRFSTPGYLMRNFHGRLYDVTNSNELAIGTSQYANEGGWETPFNSLGAWAGTITGDTTYRIEVIASIADANGLGRASNIAGVEEIYTIVEISKS